MASSFAPSTLRASTVRLAPGLALAVLIAIAATAIGTVFPIIGSAVPGIVIGVIIRLFLTPGARLKPGIAVASRFVLQLSVVTLGTQLSLAQIARVGTESLPVMLGTLLICLVAAWAFGRLLGVVGDARTLIGVGTGICGASAIAAVAPVIGAVSADIAYAVSTIFLFNIAAVIVFPIIGHALGMSQHAFGLFAGTAVNDTSSVVAAATSYGAVATNDAIVVKLVRTLMIIPICLGLAALVARRERAAGRDEDSETPDASTPVRMSARRVLRLIPWFLIGFVLMALINSLGAIPGSIHPALSAVSVFLISTALSAIGLSTDIGALRHTGARPLLLGGVLWLTVTVSSLGLQWMTTGL